MQEKIGFIGQGWIGKNYADDFEKRGYSVVRYALEESYKNNKELLQSCHIVFIAVPTPTTPEGFNYDAVRSALTLLKEGTIAVIKSTLSPGTTNALQVEFPDITVVHSPEFLREAHAAHDAANPDRNLIGIPFDTEKYQQAARKVLEVLPKAPYQRVLQAEAAELVKYAGNCFLMTKVLFMNVLFDLTCASGQSWEAVREALINDPRIGDSHTTPVHASGHLENKETKIHRGAGGHCFIKDFEAFRRHYKETVGEDLGYKMLTSEVHYNNYLLKSTGKDIDLLESVYGNNF